MSAASQSSEKRHDRRDVSDKLAVVMHAPLVGVPAAYLVSGSVAVTVLTAGVTVVTAVAYLMLRR